MAKRKNIKCAWCKELIPYEEAYVYKYVGKNGKAYDRKGHKKCFLEFIQHKEIVNDNTEYFYKVKELLMKIFNYEEDMSGVMYKSIVHNLHRKLKIDYEVIYNAVKLSENAMYKNLDKPWNYHFVIIQNYISVAQEKVLNERRLKIEREIMESEKQEKIIIKITKPTDEKPVKSVLDKKVDISTL